jgi:hypothetical protein
MPNGPQTYPVALDIDYPEHDLDRLTTLLRPILALPIAILLTLVSGPTGHAGPGERGVAGLAIEAGGLVTGATVLMLLFRRWFDWNVALVRFSARVTAYVALLRDEYPSTDEEQAVHISIPYPDASALNRWLPLVKWLFAIPHYIVLSALAVAAIMCILVAWLTILLTGRYPRPLFAFVVGVFRWWLRVAAYAFLLTTDRYPPFRLSA